MLVKMETPLLDPRSQFLSSFPTTSLSVSALNSLIRTLFSALSTMSFFFFLAKRSKVIRFEVENNLQFGLLPQVPLIAFLYARLG